MRKLFFTALILGLAPSAGASANEKVCSVKMNFDNPQLSLAWRAVNDGVMGGRSSGGPEFANGKMIFEGVINTNGGGFSSVRTNVTPGTLADASGFKMRVKSDGRAYKLTMRTNLRYRSRSVSFQIPIPETTASEWAEVDVSFRDIKASMFGRPMRGAQFDKSEIEELGIIIADGQDGPFRLEVEWIQAC